jgi:mono/diheme cytochrome c family protein
MLDKAKYTRIGLFLGICSLYLAMVLSDKENISLADEMISLGLPIPEWSQKSYNNEEIELGRKLIEEGAIPGGKRVSAFFVCTDCHLNEKEKPTFGSHSADNNIAFAKKKNLDYLPATSFYGMINQTEYYSGDYIKKYGDLVLAARNSLEGAIQLCAQECSQGRKLTENEVTYAIAYLKDKELKLTDIFSKRTELEEYKRLKPDEKRLQIKNRFNSKRQNHFGSTDLSVVSKLSGNKETGKYIFEKSCMSCHANERVSYYNIENNRLSKNDLLKRLNNKENELLSIIRYGTQPLPGSKAYMPLFTNEKLSDQHIADLIAYLNEK